MKQNLTISEVENVAVMYLKGDIDNSVTFYLREEIDSYIIKNNPKGVILDFKEVSFVDSAGIGFIIGRYNLTKKLKAYIRLSGVNDYCSKIFQISGIFRLIHCYDDVNKALKDERSYESYRIKI